MATLIARSTLTPARSPALAYERLRAMAAIPFLVGILLSFLGFAWDVQWHSDVGPNTFFTAPHLVLSSGVAIAGLTALTVVVLTTFRDRGVTEGIVSIRITMGRSLCTFAADAALYRLHQLTPKPAALDERLTATEVALA